MKTTTCTTEATPEHIHLQRITEALELAIWHIQNGQLLHASGWAASASRRLAEICDLEGSQTKTGESNG